MVTSINPPIMTTTASVSTVPITCEGTPCVIFSVPAGQLGPGNVVFVETQVEFDSGANPLKHLVTVSRQIIRAESPTATTGTPVTPNIAGDAGPGEWSYVFSLMGVDSNIPAGTYYYNVVMSAAHWLELSSESLTIPPGYGDCSILIMSQ